MTGLRRARLSLAPEPYPRNPRNFCIMRAVRRINPIYLLIVLNVALILFRNVILPDEVSDELALTVASTLDGLGVFGYVGLVLAWALCGFFFVPLLMPLNILCGALYGAYAGTAVALAGITLACIASTISARYVFTGMQGAIDRRPGVQRLLERADRYPNLTIVMVRFAVVVPYLWQNIALAATRSSVTRIALLTVVSAVPGAAIYSLLGAGLVRAENLDEILIFVAAPVLLMLALTGTLAWWRSRLTGR